MPTNPNTDSSQRGKQPRRNQDSGSNLMDEQGKQRRPQEDRNRRGQGVRNNESRSQKNH
ncbi:MAG: hypothetical protein H7Y02_12880 [Candidatus Obscuribacterales bacterium]|nr:hypothetical protein [Steroidobacteraceae bacterium]